MILIVCGRVKKQFAVYKQDVTHILQNKPENPFQPVTSQKITNFARLAIIAEIAKISKMLLSY